MVINGHIFYPIFFSDPSDFKIVFNDFLDYCNIQNIPGIDYGLI